MPKLLVGIFVGGAGRRMGGVAKGLLRSPDGDETLVTRLARVSRETLDSCDVLLVGNAEAYAASGLEALDDDPPQVGPLGGLTALLAEAERRGAPNAIALACDMPFVSPELLRRLSTHEPTAAAVAPRSTTGEWEPLCARYAPGAAGAAARAVLERGQRSLQAVLAELGASVRELPLSDRERTALIDWDTPEDVGS